MLIVRFDLRPDLHLVVLRGTGEGHARVFIEISNIVDAPHLRSQKTYGDVFFRSALLITEHILSESE